MTKLGTIMIRSTSSVYDVRKKIHDLARTLGYDDVTAVRLATATSQVCRALAADNSVARIEAGLRLMDDRTALVLRFLGPAGLKADGWLKAFFNSIEPVRRGEEGAGDNEGVPAVKWLPPNAPRLQRWPQTVCCKVSPNCIERFHLTTSLG